MGEQVKHKVNTYTFTARTTTTRTPPTSILSPSPHHGNHNHTNTLANPSDHTTHDTSLALSPITPTSPPSLHTPWSASHRALAPCVPSSCDPHILASNASRFIMPSPWLPSNRLNVLVEAVSMRERRGNWRSYSFSPFLGSFIINQSPSNFFHPSNNYFSCDKSQQRVDYTCGKRTGERKNTN